MMMSLLSVMVLFTAFHEINSLSCWEGSFEHSNAVDNKKSLKVSSCRLNEEQYGDVQSCFLEIQGNTVNTGCQLRYTNTRDCSEAIRCGERIQKNFTYCCCDEDQCNFFAENKFGFLFRQSDNRKTTKGIIQTTKPTVAEEGTQTEGSGNGDEVDRVDAGTRTDNETDVQKIRIDVHRSNILAILFVNTTEKILSLSTLIYQAIFLLYAVMISM